jgi:Lrp/AsnC family transcriptional regulator, leucine-responsive regulatory protein
MTAASGVHLSSDNGSGPGEGRTPTVNLDRTDLAILVLLLRDARSSVRKIAAEVGMSAPAVTERISRLERHGVVRGYRAEVDWTRLGYGLIAYILVTGVQGWEQVETVASLRALPEVEQVEIVTGASDLVVRLRVRDQQHLRECLFDRLWKVPGIHRTETLICLGDLQPKAFDLELAQSLSASVESDPGRTT